MSFVFDIQECKEIHRDPDGHHRHWVVLYGKLVEGEVQRETPILILGENRNEYTARLLGFEEAGRVVSGESISAAKAPDRIGLICWMPAPPRDRELLRARECTDEEREQALLAMLGSDPALFFHRIGDSDLVCSDCARALRSVADQARPLLLGLVERTPKPLAELIRAEMQRMAGRSAPRH